jgi:protein SCO1/2
MGRENNAGEASYTPKSQTMKAFASILPAGVPAFFAAIALCCAAALAQEPLVADPPELRGVGVDERLGVQLPLDTLLRDENGRPVKLGQFFDGRRPVAITLNYYGCSSLCTYQLNGLIDALRRMDWVPGQEFTLVTLSFDPLEDHRLAKAKKRAYLEEYGKAAAAKGWHFLTGERDAIHAVTETVGFHFKWNRETEQWAHSSALILCTPTGVVSRYLGGIMFEPKTLRLSLVEASQGKIGTFWDQVFLTCFRYESHEGRYVPFAWGIMRLTGGLTVVLLAVGLTAFWVRDGARRRSAGLRRAGASGIGASPS